MPNEVTKKDLDSLNKRIDALAKTVKWIDDYIKELVKTVSSHAGSINAIQDTLKKLQEGQ